MNKKQQQHKENQLGIIYYFAFELQSGEVNIHHFHPHRGELLFNYLPYRYQKKKVSFCQYTEKWSEIKLLMSDDDCSEVNSTCYSLPNKPISMSKKH